MKIIKTALCIILALAMAISLVACNNAETPGGGDSAPVGESAAPAGGNNAPAGGNNASTGGSGGAGGRETITIGVSSYLGRFLAGLSPSESIIACDGVFDSIWRIDARTKQPISDILESWTWIDDTTLHVKMRDDVYFSNGDNATAEDIVFSYSNHFERGSNYLNDIPLIMDQCVALDTYTAEFKFFEPYPIFDRVVIYLLNMSWSRSVGWDSMEWYDNPIGSGPYGVAEYVTDDHMALVAREDYWNKGAGPIAVRQWIIKYYPDSSTMFMDLELGNIDLCHVESQDYSRYLRDSGDGFDCLLLPAGCVTYFSFGFLDNPVWYDSRIREAVSYCADWDQMGKLIYGDQYVPASSMVPVESPEYINPGTRIYDPDKAMQLLAEAGYGPDNPLKLYTFMMDTAHFKVFCESFQSYAQRVGIQVDIEYGDVSSALAKWLDPAGGIDFGFLYNNFGSATFSLYNGMYGANMLEGVTFAYVDDPDFQVLMNSLAFTIDQDVVIRNAKELQQLIFDRTLMIPISEMQTTMGYRTDTFSEDQIRYFCLSVDNYQIGRLGMAYAWD